MNTDKGNWPLPEPFLPESSFKVLSSRSAIPTIHYVGDGLKDTRIRDGFPYDKYDIEQGPLATVCSDGDGDGDGDGVCGGDGNVLTLAMTWM